MVSRILRRKEVEALTGLSCSSIYRAMDEGDFPKPIQLTKQAVGWYEADIHRWIVSRRGATPSLASIVRGLPNTHTGVLRMMRAYLRELLSSSK